MASFNFAESELVAEIYAAALEQAGVPVRRELALGPRELVAPAMEQGFVDLVPEYLGSALGTASEGATVPGNPTMAHAALVEALAARGVWVLAPAPAQNQNAVVVTRETAGRLGLSRVSDLRGHASRLSIGGPPECPARPHCLGGLRSVYGLTFGEFVPLDGSERVRRALEEGVVDVAVMFTTDGHLATRALVLLEDDAHLQPPENIVPVVRTEAVDRYGAALTATLDDVSARLTTTALRLLNWRVSVAGRPIRSEARGWLTRQGLLQG